MTENNDVLIKTVDVLTKKTDVLEEKNKKIEREMKFHWRLMDIFLFLNCIVLVEYHIIPLIIAWLPLCQ